MLDEKYKSRLKWFEDRVGKTVYRNSNSCKCKICKCVENNGLIISDTMHAQYLMDVEGCTNCEQDKEVLKYFDTIEEAKEFQKRVSLR